MEVGYSKSDYGALRRIVILLAKEISEIEQANHWIKIPVETNHGRRKGRAINSANQFVDSNLTTSISAERLKLNFHLMALIEMFFFVAKHVQCSVSSIRNKFTKRR